MHLTLPNLRNSGVILAGLAYTAITFGAAIAPSPAEAASQFYFRAELAAPTETGRTIAGGTAWYCQDTTCVARKNGTRPVRVCRELSRKVGEISDFIVDTRQFETEALAECNGV